MGKKKINNNLVVLDVMYPFPCRFYEHKKLSAVDNIFELLLIDFSSSSTLLTKERSSFVLLWYLQFSHNFSCQDLQHPEECIAVPHLDLDHCT